MMGLLLHNLKITSIASESQLLGRFGAQHALHTFEIELRGDS